MEPIKWSTKKVRLGDLKPFPYNPRTMSDKQRKQLEESLERFGLVEIPALNKDLTVLAGNQRTEVLLEKEGPDHKIEARVPSRQLSEEEAREYLIRSNKNTGSWDMEMLADEFEMPDLIDLGFDTKDFGKTPVSQTTETEYTDPVITSTDIKVGDLIEIGPHRLLCEDSTVAENVTKLMDGKRGAMAFMDPPYAIFGSSTGIASDISDDNMVRPFFQAILQQTSLNVKPFAHCYYCCDWRSWASWWDMAKRTDLTVKNMIVWDKGSGQGSMYTNTHELVAFLTKTPKEDAIGRKKSGQRLITQHPANLIKQSRVVVEERHGHNAAKPVPLITRLLENSSDQGGIVVDLFLGAGSTMVACQELNRICYGMDLDPKWCQATIDRMIALEPGLSVKINGKPYERKAEKT